MLEFNCPINIVPEKKILSLENLTFGSGTPYSEILEFYVRKDLGPANLEIEIIGSYQTSSNEMRTVSDRFTLPLALLCTLCEP